MKAFFAYIPVVHAGILDYLNDNKDLSIVLLDNEKVRDVNKFLERDIRALSAEHIKSALNTYGFNDIQIADQHNLSEILKSFDEVIVPEDEIIIDLLERFAKNVHPKIVPTFIRWTKQISTTEQEVPTDRVMTDELFAKEMLATLKDEAMQSPDWWRQIAAAIVKNDEVIASAYNKHYPSAHSLSINGDPRSNLDAGEGSGIYTSIHAEAWTIAQAAKKGISTEGCDIYVTTFPCPTCARLLVEAGIKRVIYKDGYSLLDAERILKDADIEIVMLIK